MSGPAVRPEEICAVVVAYHPDGPSRECIEGIRRGAAHTVVVDNSEPAAGLRIEGATVIENGANLGLAAALNQGVRAAGARGFRWALLFDQDSQILPDTLPRLAAALGDFRAEAGPRAGLLGMNFFHQLADGAVADTGVPFAPGRSWIPRDFVITSGTAIGTEAFAAIGPFAEGYFLDHVDHEYSLRARRRGLVVGRTVQPLMVHRIGWSRRHGGEAREDNRNLINDYSPLRRYYQARNLLLLEREYGREFPDALARLRKTAQRETRRMLLHEGRRPAKVAAVLAAWRDARRGVAGRYRGWLPL